MASFVEKYKTVKEQKDTILCVGLDPALPDQRKENVIPEWYARLGDDIGRFVFCMDMVERTHPYALAFKPNGKYVRGFSTEQHQLLTKAIREHGALSILDDKLADIGDTLESGLYWVHRWQYDAVTVMTEQGNLKEIVDLAHKHDPPIGIIPMVLMSNPEAVRTFKETEYRGKPRYWTIAQEIRETGADGFVVGATGHVTEKEIRDIRAIVGDDKIALVPGVGKQEGDPVKIIRNIGENFLINVGRDLIFDKDPAQRAIHYFTLFNKTRTFYEVARAILKVPGAFGVFEEPIILTARHLSPYYIDLRLIPSFSESWKAVLKAYERTLNTHFGKFDKIITTATAGLCYGAPLADRLGVGLVYVRDPRSHGTGKRLEGKINAGDYLAGLDDLTTMGGSTIAMAEEGRNAGGTIDKDVVAFDRVEGAQEKLKELGIELIAMCSMVKDFVDEARRVNVLKTDEDTRLLHVFTSNPIGWSGNYLVNHPDYLERKIKESVKDGKLVNTAALEVLTKGHPDLKESFTPRVQQWLAEADLKEPLPDFSYIPLT